MKLSLFVSFVCWPILAFGEDLSMPKGWNGVEIGMPFAEFRVLRPNTRYLMAGDGWPPLSEKVMSHATLIERVDGAPFMIATYAFVDQKLALVTFNYQSGVQEFLDVVASVAEQQGDDAEVVVDEERKLGRVVWRDRDIVRILAVELRDLDEEYIDYSWQIVERGFADLTLQDNVRIEKNGVKQTDSVSRFSRLVGGVLNRGSVARSASVGDKDVSAFYWLFLGGGGLVVLGVMGWWLRWIERTK